MYFDVTVCLRIDVKRSVMMLLSQESLRDCLVRETRVTFNFCLYILIILFK